MSKKEKDKGSYGVGILFFNFVYDQFIGRLFTLIETLGLQGKQEEAFKSLIRQTINDIFQEGIYLDEELHTETRKKFAEIMEKFNPLCNQPKQTN